MLLLEALPGALWLSQLVPAGEELKKPT
jgi:hypothetical protein